ncbi:MAG: hypothetical protein M3R24_28905 [Chloroflexota bacterium]|nr:hypothetical protein [Chloroflexota bacterium]
MKEAEVKRSNGWVQARRRSCRRYENLCRMDVATYTNLTDVGGVTQNDLLSRVA